ncbi:MAG: YdcF family protein [Deltaproteobacteria bacterium]|nr:YdcF family protein [Deltaproteobacteria bacterium]
MAPSAILVLGARVRSGRAGPALSRRIEAASEAAARWPDAAVIVCGGRAWDGVVEADVMARALAERGVHEGRIVRERLSLNTVENLRHGAALARTGRLAVVTCDWHEPRAIAIARAMGLDAVGFAARAPESAWPRRLARAARERLLRALIPLVVVLAVLATIACRRAPPPHTDAGAPLAALSSLATVSSAELVAARVAADLRQSEGVAATLASSPDVAARRAAARALSQIGDPGAIERLGRSLVDEDAEVVAWSAYGLGLPCDVDPELSREDRARIVRAVVARSLSLEARALSLEGKQATAAIDPWRAIAWTLGRCGGIEASRELARWLRRDVTRARAAAWALGAIAHRDHGLEDDVANALIDAVRGGDGGAPLDDALYPFAPSSLRNDWASRPPTPGLAEVARARLATAGPGRVFAIRALGRAEGAKPDDLRAIVNDPVTPENERVEALRALHWMGAGGDAEIAAFATRNAPVDDAATLEVPVFGAVRVAVELLGDRAPTPTTLTSLRAFVPKGMPPLSGSPNAVRRRATLRCLAATALHPGKPGEAEVVRCAAHDPSLPVPLRAELDALRDLARLAALDRSEITGDRRELLLKLARDGVPRVRERALGMLGKHAEAEEAPEIVIKALAAKSHGVVAAAAQAIADRPSVAFVLSKKAIEKALDPSAPPPDKTEPDRTVEPKVLEALDGALSRPLEEADAETKTALAAAVSALKHQKARGFALRLCGDRSPAMRRAGRDALARLDPPGKAPTCTTIDDHGTASPHASAPPAKKTLRLETSVGALTLALDPVIAPVAVARVAELAASGFYDGTPIHRVVPGFVVQLGDPGGDGYGGAHSALRCETAPVAFEEGDVGVALAGRDTGSSQIFVMLGRAPHLDGSYAWLGKASGPWAKIAEGDVIVRASVE